MEELTYLEEFLSSVELLPNDIRRDFELIRELDKESLEASRELSELEQKMIQKAMQIRLAPDVPVDEDDVKAMMSEITSLRQKAKQRLSQKTSIASNVLLDVEKFMRKLDTDLAFFETELRGCGEFEQLSRGVEPGSDVAIRLSQASNEIILGRVIFYHADIGMYDIADVDNSKRYSLHETQVCVLDLADNHRRLCKGEEILAVYPDTTSFYPAIVTQASRRATLSSEPAVTVQFTGDEDEAGQTPQRIIPLRHALRPPDAWAR